MKKEEGLNIAPAAIAGGTNLVKNNWKFIVGFGAASIAGYSIYKQFFGDDGVFGEGTKPPKLKTNPKEAPSSLSQTQINSIASQLFYAMYTTGTDETAIYDALEGVTYNDFVKISEAFGEKSYDGAGESIVSFLTFIWPKIGLIQWLTAELTPQELAQVQMIVPNLLSILPPVEIGRTVLSKKSNLQVYTAEEIDGVWHKGEAFAKYPKGAEIGEVEDLIEDKWEGKTFAVIDMPWGTDNFFGTQKLFVETSNLMAI